MWTVARRAAHGGRPLVSASPRHLVRALSSTSTASSAASSPASPPRVGRQCRVLCVDVPADVAEPTCVQELVQRGHVVDHLHAKTPDQLAKVVDQYDALLISPTTSVPREVLERGAKAKLKLVAVPAATIDSELVDVMDATSQGVLLLQLDKQQAGDTYSVEAEASLRLLVHLARHIPSSVAAVRTGHAVRRQAFTGTELHGKKLGVIGLGKAGAALAELAQAMGMRVCGFDPNVSAGAAELLGVQSLPLDQVYAQADVLAFHAPLTGATKGMFDASALEQCKDGVRIISVAEYKGTQGILDTATLLQGLESGKIAGVGLDFLEDDTAEGKGGVDELWTQLTQHPHVVTARHAASKTSSVVTEATKYHAIAENVADALAQRYYRGAANGVFLPMTLVPEMQPFLSLADALGRFLYHVVFYNDPTDRITKLSVATRGGLQLDITKPKAKAALQSAVLNGLLHCIRDAHGGEDVFGTPHVSLLNASLLAMRHGIDVRLGDLSDADTSHLNNSLAVRVQTQQQQDVLLMGSVFGSEPRVVRINEFTDLPAFRPEGNLLMFRNEDKPGAIAGILDALQAAHVNIANFGLARQGQGDVTRALGILSLDEPLAAETLAVLKQLPSVESVHYAPL